jgi:hypothetical protein
MNRDDIIRMAREADAAHDDVPITPFLDRFAALVAEHERERCARLVEQYTGAWDDKGYALAQAIRQRGKE